MDAKINFFVKKDAMERNLNTMPKLTLLFQMYVYY